MRKCVLILTVTLLWAANFATAGEKVFVAESFSNQVGVLDTTDFAAATQAVNVGLTPQDMKLTADGKTLYVANYLSHDLTEIDPLTLSVRRTINLSCSPSVLAISPDANTGYALCRNTGRIVYVDLPSGTEITTIPIVFPYGLAMTPDAQKAYVSRSMMSRYVDVIDLPLRKLTTSITVGRSPQGIIVGPSGQSVYTANAGAASVSVIDTATNSVRTTIAVGNSPTAVAVDSIEKYLYVANKNDATVSVVDLEIGRTIVTIPVGVSPQALALANADALLYVANFNSNTLSLIDTQTHQVVMTLPVGNGPQALAVLVQTDNAPPEVSLSVSADILWPPNHKMVPITVQIAVSDDQDPNPTIQLASITSNEPCSDATDANNSLKLKGANPSTCTDIAEAAIGTNDDTFLLRAERFGYSAVGRVYTITYKVTDAAGNETLASSVVQVPLNFSGRGD
jgi:YVTN family beta-propeller protein